MADSRRDDPRGRRQRGEPPPLPATSRRKDIAEVFESERTRFGEPLGDDNELGPAGDSGEDALSGGDPDASPEDVTFVGEEAPGGPQPLPDQDSADAAGEAYGVSYGEEEELSLDKVGERDRDRRREVEPGEDERPPPR